MWRALALVPVVFVTGCAGGPETGRAYEDSHKNLEAIARAFVPEGVHVVAQERCGLGARVCVQLSLEVTNTSHEERARRLLHGREAARWVARGNVTGEREIPGETIVSRFFERDGIRVIVVTRPQPHGGGDCALAPFHTGFECGDYVIAQTN